MASKKMKSSAPPKSVSVPISPTETSPNLVPDPTPEPKKNETRAKKSTSRTTKPPETAIAQPDEAEVPAADAKLALEAAPAISVEHDSTEPAPKKSESKKAAKEKATKLKRLTLDIPKPLHKAIKAQAVEEGIPMVDMLRTLLEKHYGKS